MEWVQFVIFFIGVFGLFIWNRAEAREDARHMDAQLKAQRELIAEVHRDSAELSRQIQRDSAELSRQIQSDREEFSRQMQAEIKDFHGRLCAIEERKIRND